MGNDNDTIRVLRFDISKSQLKSLTDRHRKLLIWSMHAHNEITVLNRIFLFCLNDPPPGELEETSHTLQLWCIAQLLSAKLYEAWLMVRNYLLLGSRDEALLSALDPSHKDSLKWLSDYFGVANLKKSVIKVVRDNTTSHYGDIDTGKAQKALESVEMSVYLAQHPVNALYYLGSAIAFRAMFGLVADQAGIPRNDADRERLGARHWISDVRDANDHMHKLLYGVIKYLLEEARGDLLGAAVEDIHPDAAKYSEIQLPLFLDIGRRRPAT